jgi:hypothetical protein
MRALLMLLLLPLPVLAASPALEMLQHQCGAIDPARTAFQCTIKPGGGHYMILRLTEERESMNADRRAASKYEMNRISVLYHAAGGRKFMVTSPFWPTGKIMMCVISSPDAISCSYLQCDANGVNCLRIK